jgi:hypothetical protein
MSTAKDILIKVIDSASSRKIVERYHYSGKCVQNSQIHFGVFLNGRLEGALQFGPSMDRVRMAKNLGIGFNESLELNRMALSDACPKNSESRAIGICLRMIKKKYPHLKIIISFSDACQCGDGIIYRASGFKLHSIKKNKSLIDIPGFGVVAQLSLDNSRPSKIQTIIRKKFNAPFATKTQLVKLASGKEIIGFQMKYLYFFDKKLQKKFKFVDFDKIPNEVRMYKGLKRAEHESNASGFQSEESGAIPTGTLHSISESSDEI